MKNSIKCLFAAMLVIFVASCQKEENLDKPGKSEPRTITATLANNDPQTKTHLDENLKTLWSEGDTIWISDGTNSAKIQLIKGEGEPEEGYIKGTLAADEKSFTFEVPSGWGSTVYAVYPAFVQDGIDGGLIRFKIPSVQSGKFGDANISVAKESDNVLQFKNATAVIKFVQTAKTNMTVCLSAHTQLAGRVKIAYGDPFTVTADNPEMTGVTASFVDDTVSYVAVASGTASNLVVNVIKSDFSSADTVVASKLFAVNKVYRTSVTGMTSYESMKTYSGANCHIIPCGGTFKLDVTKKGNSQESVGAVNTVEVLWESFGTATVPEEGDVIAQVYFTGNYAYIGTIGNEGNAVVAAKDASGNILWSWHIWVCSGYDPEKTKQEYNNSAGFMMDRNLGATSTTPGDVHALGLLYQWGRKDPFLGADAIYYASNPKQAASTLTWPDPVAAQDNSSDATLNLRTSIKNPTAFITSGSDPKDWYCTNSDYKNDTLWKTSAGKTIYDPCPAGWRVPDGGKISVGGVWAWAFNQDGEFFESGFANGFDFGVTSNKLVSSGQCWYPAAGYRFYSDGLLGNVGSSGNYWSSRPCDLGACCLYFYSSGDVDSEGIGKCANGYSVRCIKE